MLQCRQTPKDEDTIICLIFRKMKKVLFLVGSLILLSLLVLTSCSKESQVEETNLISVEGFDIQWLIDNPENWEFIDLGNETLSLIDNSNIIDPNMASLRATCGWSDGVGGSITCNGTCRPSRLNMIEGCFQAIICVVGGNPTSAGAFRGC